MLIFLYGPDSYRRQKELNKILKEYLLKYSSLSYDCFDLDPSAGSGRAPSAGSGRVPSAGASQEEFFRLKEFASQRLIFDNKKLAILKNIYEADPQKLKEFLKFYLNSEDFTILVSEDKAATEGLKSIFKKAFLVNKFDNLEAEKWRFFIEKEARQKGIVLTSRAIDFLEKEFKANTWALINELEKLSLIFPACRQGGENHPVDIEDLKKISDYYQSPNIFEFINSVSRNWSLGQKLVALEKLFISQEEPVKIFNILASQNRLSDILLKKLADYDVMVKSGKIDYEEVLIDLALE